MHPEVRQRGPGVCPKCGMALEPVEVSASAGDERNPALEDMSRRLRVSVALAAPVLALAMSDLLPGMPVHHALGARTITWLELSLSTPVVLWAGWPLFQRGWASVTHRSPNMF